MDLYRRSAKPTQSGRFCRRFSLDFFRRSWIILLTSLWWIGMGLLFPIVQAEAKLKVGLRISQKTVIGEKETKDLRSLVVEEMFLKKFREKGWDTIDLPDGRDYPDLDVIVTGEVTIQNREVVISGLPLPFLYVDLGIKVIEATSGKTLKIIKPEKKRYYKKTELEAIRGIITEEVIEDILDEISKVQEEDQIKEVNNKWALVVGIANFQDNEIKPLDYSDDDAEAMYNFLIDPNLGRFNPGNVIKLINQQATTTSIKKAIDKIATSTQSNDIVVVYVSTHGTPGKSDIAGVSYVVTYDTKKDSLYATAYEMTHLAEALKDRIKANRVVAFLDTCYSAGSLRGVTFTRSGKDKDLTLEIKAAGIDTESIKKMAQGIGRVIISSSGPDERSWESDTLQHGYFTYYLLDALKKREGLVTIDEVYGYLKKEVPTIVAREKNGAPQNPQIKSSEKRGRFSLGIPSSAP